MTVDRNVHGIKTAQSERVLLAHGSGGKLMHGLIDSLFKPLFLKEEGVVLNDSAVFNVDSSRLAITTDSFVVDPIFFPGGDIGKLAVNGTVNDLAVSGAVPLLLSAAFILEEGLPLADLRRIAVSMQEAAEVAGVSIVTGDTKVVKRGQCEIYINTTGIGVVTHRRLLSADAARAGDLVILNGDIAAHGIAVMTAREQLEFARPVYSDTCSLRALVEEMLKTRVDIRCMRDLTRGGLSAALNEIAVSSAVGIRIWQNSIPVQDEVRGCCEVLGLDPLLVANEGKLVSLVDRQGAQALLAAMQSQENGRRSAVIGEVVAAHPGMVVMKTEVEGWRIIDTPAGEQLPRIC